MAVVLRGDGRGGVRVEGEAIDEAGIGNKLTFGFDIDQTYLPGITRSLEATLLRFPILGSPDA